MSRGTVAFAWPGVARLCFLMQYNAVQPRRQVLSMAKHTHKFLGWVLVVAALMTFVDVAVPWRVYQARVSTHRDVMFERGQTVLTALAAAVRSQTRGGRYHQERLDAIFEELAATPGILSLELRAEKGKVIASGGDTSELMTNPPARPFWEEGRLYLPIRVEVGHEGPRYGRMMPRRQGGGGIGPWTMRGEGRREEGGEPPEGPPPDGIPWSPEPHVLTVVLNTSEVAEAMAQDRLQLTVVSLVGLAAIGLGVLVALAGIRHRKLRTELLVANERAEQHERLARLGAGLAHETKNPLGLVRGLAQSVSSAGDATPEIKQMANAIVDEADRTVGQINSFLLFARPKEADLKPISLDVFFEAFLPLLRAEAGEAGVTVRYEPSGITILADEDALRRLVLNLVANAIRACADEGRVVMSAERCRDTVAVRITDNGCGIAFTDLPHVMEPYFTRFEGGCGLGLAIVEQIARAHGWVVSLDSSPETGTQVSIDGISAVG
jgi:two-component system, NtrC family, sensor histidine kinase HydH